MSWLKIKGSPDRVVDPRLDKPPTKYSPEYKFLLNLVYVLGKEGIPEEKIQEVIHKRSLSTVGDVEMVTTELWTMATRDFKIPNDWLITEMEKQR